MVEVSTDKVDAEVPAPASGTITKIQAQVDETVKVGQVLAEMSAGAARPGRALGPATEPRCRAAEPAAPPAPATRRKATADPAESRMAPAELPLSPAGSPPPAGSTWAQSRARDREARSPRRMCSPRPTGRARRRRSPRPQRPGEAKPLRGPAGMLAQAMNESRSVPTATSFRTLPVDVLDAKRKALNGVLKDRGMKVSFTHLIAWAIVKAATEWRVMARVYEERDGKPQVVEPGRRQPGDRGRRRAQGVAKPDGALHQGGRPARLRLLPRVLRGADHQDAREQADRRRLPGDEHHPHKPGRARHGRVGSPPAEGPGNDRRDRLDRLPGGVGPRSRRNGSRRWGSRR